MSKSPTFKARPTSSFVRETGVKGLTGSLMAANLSKSPASSGLDVSNATWQRSQRPIDDDGETNHWDWHATEVDSPIKSPASPAVVSQDPPAISYSILQETTTATKTKTTSNERITLLDDRVRAIIKTIQELLDTQSRLLLSPTPTPRTDPTSINEVRARLDQAMGQLSRITREKGQVLAQMASSHSHILERLQSCGDEKVSLMTEINQVQERAQDETGLLKTRQLQVSTDEAIAATEAEIQRLQTRLSQLKRQKELVEDDLDRSNSVIASRTSRFKARLAATQDAESRYLQRASLPPTKDIEAAKEILSTQLTALEGDQASISREIQALDDGGIVWHAVCDTVKDTEQRLRRVVQEAQDEDTKISQLIKILTESEAVLSQRHDLAVQKNWSLLVVAIGHELEAIKRGIYLLKEE